MDVPNKDSYDELLQFNRITQENWLAPDRKGNPPSLNESQWIEFFLAPRLDGAVPRDIVKVFEMARAAMIYSWFFYPLATLGLEQCTRVAEFAIRERCRMLLQEPGTFAENIATLHAAGVISPQDEPRWQACRRIRNDRSHLNGFVLLDPGFAGGRLRTFAELINKLFPNLS